MLLVESGCRMHATEFELPKNMQPSGFSMKVYSITNHTLNLRRQGSDLTCCPERNLSCLIMIL